MIYTIIENNLNKPIAKLRIILDVSQTKKNKITNAVTRYMDKHVNIKNRPLRPPSVKWIYTKLAVKIR